MDNKKLEKADTRIDLLVASIFSVRQQKSALEKTEKAMVGELKPLVDPHFDNCEDLGIPVSEFVLHAGKLDLLRTMGTNRSISADKLLERGVAPDVIQSATGTSTYYQYRIKEIEEPGT